VFPVHFCKISECRSKKQGNEPVRCRQREKRRNFFPQSKFSLFAPHCGGGGASSLLLMLRNGLVYFLYSSARNHQNALFIREEELESAIQNIVLVADVAAKIRLSKAQFNNFKNYSYFNVRFVTQKNFRYIVDNNDRLLNSNF
jgi:hypothetical protein